MTESAAKPRGAGLSADEFSAAVSAVTSAFGDPTRRDIYLFVRAGADGVTAAEVAERFDLHPNVARHHLEKLTAGGYLTVELARHETAGRPSKRYRAGELDTSLNFPPRRDDLLATLLARSLELLDPDQAAAMAEEVGYDYGVAIAARMTPETEDPAAGHRSVRAALATVADALTAHGFAAHAEASGTEAVNTAVWGAVARADAPVHIVTTAVEHSAVLDACRRSDAEVAVVGVDRLGRYDPAQVLDAVRPETALVTAQLANHEVGTI